jgi:hypothetical protein
MLLRTVAPRLASAIMWPGFEKSQGVLSGGTDIRTLAKVSVEVVPVAVILRPNAPRIAVVGIVLSFALAVAVGILRTVNAEPVERAAEVAGNVAFAVVFAAPALLALLGLRDRPPLLVAAGALDLGLAFVTLISLIGLVFLVPGAMFFVAAGQMRGAGRSPSRSIAAVVVAVLVGIVAFFALFAREDPVCWARNPTTGELFRLNPDRFVHDGSISINSRDLPPGATESGCSSDSISTGEAIAGIAVVAAMLGAVWILSKPSQPRATPLPTVSDSKESGKPIPYLLPYL